MESTRKSDVINKPLKSCAQICRKKEKKTEYSHKIRFQWNFVYEDVTMRTQIMTEKKKNNTEQKKRAYHFVNQEKPPHQASETIRYEKKEMLYRMCNVYDNPKQMDTCFLLCFFSVAFIQFECFARRFWQQIKAMRRITNRHKSILRTGNKFIQQIATDQETHHQETCGSNSH